MSYLEWQLKATQDQKHISVLIEVEGDDSWGISMAGEIPQERSDEEAQPMPPGKRPPETEINDD